MSGRACLLTWVELEQHLGDQGFGGDFYVVQSTGGLFPAAHARVGCVRMLESGPAAGVIGAQAICAQLGMGDAIAFDMGGTTAKAGVISEGRPLTTGSALIGGYERALPIQIPMMDIHEVGTGGGSLPALKPGNALRVGPAECRVPFPGPVAYGRGGTEPTVTDANLLLGRLDADHFLGGELRLDLEGCRQPDGSARGRSRWAWTSPRTRPMASCESPSPRCRTPSRR
jgi:N-methylhydantoinase A